MQQGVSGFPAYSNKYTNRTSHSMIPTKQNKKITNMSGYKIGGSYVQPSGKKMIPYPR